MNMWQPIETAPRYATAILVMRDIWPGTRSGRAEECNGRNTYVAAWWPDERGGQGAWICYMDAVLDPECPVEPTHWMPLPDPPGAQPAPNAVAYLDLGVGGYMDIGTDLTDEELDAIPKGRHMLGIVGTYGVEGYVPAQPAPSVPDGWLRAIDEALVTAHIGVAKANDTYEQAKAQLDNLIGFFVDVATDPAVNGGFKLMPVEPTKEIYECFSAYDGTSYSNPFDFDDFRVDYGFALEAAPEAKP